VILVGVVDLFVIVTLLPGSRIPNCPDGADGAEPEVEEDE
jgi:hypothetical protein